MNRFKINYFGFVCLLSFLSVSFLYGQKTWNPTVISGSSYLWSNPNNWLPNDGFIPGIYDDVTIPSGTFLCTIPDVVVTPASVIPSAATLTSISVTSVGSGYATAPTISFTGGGGSGATATATVSSGSITSITLTSAGTGYSSAPTVVITGGGGTGGAATCNASISTSPYYRCKSLTIQSNAAVYNQATAGNVAVELTIINDLIINNNGYYFSGAQSMTIGRDLWIQGGADTNASPGGSLIMVLNSTNKINVGRHYLNEGTLARKTIGGTSVLTMAFNTTQNAFIYNKTGLSRDRNIFVSETITGRTTYNFTAVVTGTIFKCGAFDNMEVTKNKSTIENCGVPGGTYPGSNTGFTFNRTSANVNTAIQVGIVGDGVNDFDSAGGTDVRNTLFVSGTGKLSVFQGCVYVNNVGAATANAYTTEMLHSSSTNRVWDGSTTHPQGSAFMPLNGLWGVPNADINIRGDLVISNALFGTGTYNGASIDLYGFTTSRKDSICMHLGGNIQDLNTTEPAREDIATTTSTTRRGLYVNPSDQIYNSFNFQLMPVIVFNGIADQTIEGYVTSIRDFNNIASQGQGMVMPNVIVRKPNGNSTKVSPSGSGGNAALRIFGQLTIFSGEFNTNGLLLLFGDNYNDEITVHSIGNPADAAFSNIFAQGKFYLNDKSILKMCSDNDASNGDFLAIGAIMRGRRGGEVRLEASNASNQAAIARDSRVGGRLRIAMYSGARFRARYCGFQFPSPQNTGYDLTGAGTIQPSTPGNSDNTTGGAASRGGLKIYSGATLWNYTTSVYENPVAANSLDRHSLSDCTLEGVNNNTLITFNAIGFFRIVSVTLNDNDNNNNSCISYKTEGEVRFYQSSGSAGGVVGEIKDGGSADAPSVPDRVVWDNSTTAIWKGGTSTSWNNYLNWVVPDQTGGLDDAGFPQNPDHLVPGVASFNDVGVVIPRKADRNCVADVAFSINSSLIMEGSGNIYRSGSGVSFTLETGYLSGLAGYSTYLTAAAADKTFTINTGLSVEVKNDMLMYWETTVNLSANSTLNLGGNFMALYCRTSNVISATNNATINASAGSTLYLNGDKNQQISPRANKLFNYTVAKPSGTANIQGISYQTNTDGTTGGSTQYTFRLDGNASIIDDGKFRTLSDTRLDIKGDFIQTQGIFEPLNSIVILRGNFTGSGGSSIAGSQVFSFHPFPNAILSRNITVTTNHKFNNVELSNSTTIPIGNGTNETIATNTNTVTYNMASNFDVLGTLNIFTNRVMTNKAYTLKAGNLTVNTGGRFNLLGTNSGSGSLQMYTSGTNAINVLAGGRIDMLGTENNYVKITRADNLSRYAFNISGSFSSRYYISEYTDANGIYIRSGATSISPGVITVDGGGKNYVNGATTVTLTPVYEGTNAAATATISGSGLTNIYVDNGGSGYTVAPTVVLTSVNGGETAGTATAVMVGSPLNTIYITGGGSGYADTDGIITGGLTIAAPTGTPALTASADAIVDNRVTSTTVTPGIGLYSQAPTITFGAPPIAGTTAIGRGVLTASTISGIVITAPGTGYSVGDVLTFIGADGGTGPTAQVATIDVNGGILTLGSFTSFATPLKQPISVGEISVGDGAIYSVSVTPTTLASIEILDGGYGYDQGTAPTITITKSVAADTDGASATSTITNPTGTIRGVNIISYGDGYLSPPTITISGGGGTGATASSTTDGGSLQSITINTAGSYFSAPNVSFTGGGGGSGATGTAETDGGAVSSFTLTTPGSGYRTAPIVTVSSTAGGIGTGASAYAKITPSYVTQINILNGGSGYGTTKPTLVLRGANPDASPASPADETIPAANIIVSNGVITRVKIINKGLGYLPGDVLNGTGGAGTGALFVVVADSSSYIKTGSNPSYPVGLSISKGGSGFIVGDIINTTCSSCSGLGSGAQFQVISEDDGVITNITPFNGIYYSTSNQYSTSPNLIITVAGSGSNFSAKPILAPGVVTSVVVKPKRRYPVASLSNGIYTNSAYGASAAALSFDATFSFYRTANPLGATVAPFNLNPVWTAGASPGTGFANDWNYAAASSSTGGPRIDSIYNVIFAKNPAVDVGGDYTLSKNVNRIGNNNNAQNRIIFKDAIGTFSGEGYDLETAVTAVAINAPNAQLNPFGISTSDSMVLWREPNVKRWDGGPDNLGTSWSDPQNWRPDGVPKDFNDVILDYTLLNVDYTGSAALGAGKPMPQVPTSLVVDMNYDFTGIVSATCKSLTFVPIIQPQLAGQNQNTDAKIKMDVNDKLRVAGTISIPNNATLNVNQANNIIEVGETWTNSGTFNNGNGVVNFYKNSSRAIINSLNPVNPASVDTDLSSSQNGFYKVTFTDGVSDMSSNMLVLSNLTIGESATLNSNNRTIYLNGNWDNAGLFDPSGGTGAIFFRGSALQTVKKTGTTLDTKKQNFYNVVMGKGSGSGLSGAQGHVKLLNRVQVTGNLYLNSGRILASRSTNTALDNGSELILSQAASIQGSPSVNSFVQGPVGRLTNSTSSVDLNYPLGSEKQGSGFTATITTTSGTVTGITPVVAGTGYEVSNRFTIPGGNGDATVVVTAVNGSGGITALNVAAAGTGYSNGAVTPSWLLGSGRGIYVGPPSVLTGSLILKDIVVNSTDLTMFVSEQIENKYVTNPTTRTLPTGAPNLNYIFEDRYWTVRNIPYLYTGTSSNATLTSSKIQLYLSPNSTVTSINGTPLNSADITSNYLKDARVIKDSDNAYNGTGTPANDPTYISATPSLTAYSSLATATKRLKDGLAVMSTAWLNAGSTTVTPATDVTSTVNSTAVVSNDFTSMGNGDFAIALNYTPLPIDGLTLEAKLVNAQVQIKWAVVGEQAINKYLVERSRDGITFESLGEQTAKNSPSVVYTYLDKKPLSGTSYYRITQIKKDGKSNTSNLVSIVYDNTLNNEKAFIVYPNPLSSGADLNVQMPSVAQGEQILVSLMDINGRIVFNQSYVSDGNILTINFSRDLAEGLYIMNVKSLNDEYKTKIMINR